MKKWICWVSIVLMSLSGLCLLLLGVTDIILSLREEVTAFNLGWIVGFGSMVYFMFYVPIKVLFIHVRRGVGNDEKE